MTPPARVAWGLLLVFIDLRFNGFDVIPDMLGWVLIVWGAAALRGRSGWFELAGAGGIVGTVLSVPLLLAEPGPALMVVEALAQTAVVFGTCSGVRAVTGEASVTRTADGIRWLDLGLLVVLLLAWSVTGPVPVETVWAIPLAVVSFGVVIWFLVFLFRLTGHPTLQERSHAVR